MFGAVVNGATVAGFVLGGVLLTMVPVRAAIAAAGLGGLAVTAAFARPVLRARAHEQGLSEPGAGRPDLNEPGAGRPDLNEPGARQAGGRLMGPDGLNEPGARPDLNEPRRHRT